MKIYKVKVNGKTYKVELESVEEIVTKDKTTIKAEPKKEEKKVVSTGEGREILAPIQGVLLDIKVKVGDTVKKGDILLLIEAMKLENEVCAPCDGVISEILATKGNTVTSKQLLLKIK